MPNILITTFGTTWQIIPELLGFTNPGLVDLYANHPGLDDIRRSRRDASIKPADEIWLITTKGRRTDESVESVFQWRNVVKERPDIPCFRIWQVADTEDLASEAECRLMSECIHRLVLHASERVGNGQLIISLAGGRKTMSSDMQGAAVTFGCHALVHVIQNENYAAILRKYGPDDFSVPFPGDLNDAITPLVTGRYGRSPVVDGVAGGGPIRSFDYPIAFPEGYEPVAVRVETTELVREIRERQDKAGFLYCNYTNRLMNEDSSSNFLALYSLPPDLIEALKERRIGVSSWKREAELAWLKRLPKTELHCHLGGIADIREIIEIAAANREQVALHQGALTPWLDGWKQRLDRDRAEGVDFKDLRRAVSGVPEPVCTAAFILLFEDRSDLLDEIVYGPFRDESRFCGIGFRDYEALGDLQGSGLLQSEESLRAACGILKRQAAEHNVKYLELRCSPINYIRAGLKPEQVVEIIDHELSSGAGPLYSLIFTASRHGKMSKVHEHIELAGELMGGGENDFTSFRGFDLAGDERAGSPSQMREAFMSMMEKCMRFTIHAGETQDVSSIWEAVYHLNAERIGHGLTLRENPDLLERFKDRNIAVEMCPSSNFQIRGFRDNHLPSTDRLEEYPLKEYLDRGLRVTVNTDNPGISRTDFTKELHRAARLTPGGLSLWEILLLVRNGFKAAFCPRSLRQNLIREAETRIIDIIKEGLPS